jgi:hypothetical protein
VKPNPLTRFRVVEVEARGGDDREDDKVEGIVNSVGIILLISICV